MVYKSTEDLVCAILREKFRCVCADRRQPCEAVRYLCNLIHTKGYENPNFHAEATNIKIGGKNE